MWVAIAITVIQFLLTAWLTFLTLRALELQASYSSQLREIKKLRRQLYYLARRVENGCRSLENSNDARKDVTSNANVVAGSQDSLDFSNVDEDFVNRFIRTL